MSVPPIKTNHLNMPNPTTSHHLQPAKLTLAGNVAKLQGAWTTLQLSTLLRDFDDIDWPKDEALIIDGQHLAKLDSLGAEVIVDLLNAQSNGKQKPTLRGFNQQHQALLDLIKQKKADLDYPKPPSPLKPLAQLGKSAMDYWTEFVLLLQFVGELTFVSVRSLRHFSLLQWRLLVNIIQRTGLDALPIVGLLSFLIGIVLAYQMGVQLETYGANVYIVDLTGIAVLREFAPLMTAIIVAGRTSSSFTAEIGSMKVHEEIDALQTFGLNPNELLSLPKILGLVVALPLLTVWSDIFGVLGGMLTARNMLKIPFSDFLLRFKQNIAVSHFVIGIGKTPVFAVLIAAVGCYHGFRVSGSADSVGRHTTQSVVLAIFLIIIADAIFSILFSRMGL